MLNFFALSNNPLPFTLLPSLPTPVHIHHPIFNRRTKYFMFEFPCIITLYYIKNQQDATLTVSFISHCKITLHVSDAFCVHNVRGRLPLHCSAVATDLGHPYWMYIIPTHGMHQWLLLQFLVLLMMEAESVRNV